MLDFEVVVSSEVSQDGKEAQEAVFEFTHAGERRTWRGKALTLTSGQLGFVVSGVTRRAVLDTYEPALDAILASLTVPGVEFTPPAPAITNATIATAVDEVTAEPIVTGTKFSSGTNKLYTAVMVHNVPLGSTIEFVWAQVDAQGNKLQVINRTEGAFPGTGNVWALIEPEQGLRRGWYESQVFVNDELFVTLPFAIDLSEFLNERLGVAFSYPSGWTIDDSNPGLIQLMPAPGGVVQVGAFMFGPRTLDAVVSELAEGFTSLGFREVSRMTLDEEVQGYLLRFDVSFENVTVVFDTVIKFAGARLFLVSLAVAETLLDSLRADFELLTDSFSITLSPTGEPIDAGAGVSEIQGAIERRVVAVRGLEAGPLFKPAFKLEKSTGQKQVVSLRMRNQSRRSTK